MKIKTLVPLTILFVGVAVSYADVLTVKLSPAGTGPAVGLSSLNEVPVVTNSAGSGGEIFGGITFDTATLTLNLAVGYGSATGFTDLTGPATAMHIHGPGGVTNAAPVLFALAGLHLPAGDPAKGGVIFGAVPYTAVDASNLLAGLHYINIHTLTNPAGEIRAQLIVVSNSAPTLDCPASVTNECTSPAGAVVNLTANVSDAEGDALTVVWMGDGVAIQTNSIPAGPAGATNEVHFIAQYGDGSHQVDISVSDGQEPAVTCSTTVTVVDTAPPVIQSILATPNVLWPPNHKLVSVNLDVVATDVCGSATSRIVSVTSNEPENGLGDGDTDRDWQITGDLTLQLRAERSGTGIGRIYTVEIESADEAGNTSTSNVTVSVPHSKGKGKSKR